MALGALFGSLSAVFLMDAVGRKASLLAFSVMSLFIGWTLLMAASQVSNDYFGSLPQLRFFHFIVNSSNSYRVTQQFPDLGWGDLDFEFDNSIVCPLLL